MLLTALLVPEAVPHPELLLSLYYDKAIVRGEKGWLLGDMFVVNLGGVLVRLDKGSNVRGCALGRNRQ